MKKEKDTNAGNANEVQVLNGLDAESIEIVTVADHEEDDTSGDQSEVYRVWNCNGVTIGVRLHKDKS